MKLISLISNKSNMYRLLTLLLILCAVSLIAAAKFPSNLERCHQGDTSCLTTIMNKYVRDLKDGRRDLNMVSLDPLHVDEVDIIQSRDSPVNINLNFKDVLFYGLSDLDVKKVIGFDKDPATSKFEIYASVDQLSLIGQYKVNGNVIILPVVGSGPANLTFDNVDFVIKFIPKVETKKGKQYLQFSDVKLDFTTTRLYMQFSNLFNGDKTLSDGTNRFLNENWLDILTELKPVLKKAIGNICNGVVGPIFAKFPYNDLFL